MILSRNGSRGPNAATEADPTTSSGSRSTILSKGSPSTMDGALGCAPNQSSACGSPVGSTPSSSGITVGDPHA